MSSPTSSSIGKRKTNDNKKIRVHLLINGRVQGVYFRQNTKIVASNHGVNGWIRNLKDGRVHVLLEGNEAAVGKVIEWCQVGPTDALVNYVDIKYEEYTGEFQEFMISY
jgi:acylphosphatase